MALRKRYKPELTEREKEKRRRFFIAGTYATVSTYILLYFLAQYNISSIQIVRFTLSFLITAESMPLGVLKMLIEGLGPEN